MLREGVEKLAQLHQSGESKVIPLDERG